MIGSRNALFYSYLMYLIGRTELKVDEHVLRPLIARWFVMVNLTGRYTGSPESNMEFDLAQLRGVKTPDAFVAALEKVIRGKLTSDFWEITLVNELASSSSTSPALRAYQAALIRLGARALYSKLTLAELADPSFRGSRKSLEKHHLFPRKLLEKRGLKRRQTNQIANFAWIEWRDNVDASSKPPSEYVPLLEKRFSAEELREMYRFHALPDGWAEMDYDDFLNSRREQIARVVREAFDGLELPNTQPTVSDEASVEDLVAIGEGTLVEFKATLRMNRHTQKADSRLEHAVIKTVAGFLNAHGGTLVVGVQDDGTALGIEVDGFENEDKMALHLTNLLRDRLGPQHLIYVHPKFEDFDGSRVLSVLCSPSRSPVYMKDGNTERFYVRTGPSTTELKPSQIQAFVKERF